jgi:hypothetical protein
MARCVTKPELALYARCTARGGAGKAQLIEHAQRPSIVRQRMRVKFGDTGIAGDKCQMMQHR